VVFDFENIVPFIVKHKSDPVTGDAVTSKDVTRLTMAKNADGVWHCPITCKIFTNTSHVVAIKTATQCHVYSYDAVQELNIKTRNFVDLSSGEPFKKSDIITLQNPQDKEQAAQRDVSNFVHLKKIREESAEARAAEGSTKHNPTSAKVMKEIEDKQRADREAGVKRKTIESISETYRWAFTTTHTVR
jgi:peptidyl-prolyl cis-trans isomerase-like protein 2